MLIFKKSIFAWLCLIYYTVFSVIQVLAGSIALRNSALHVPLWGYYLLFIPLMLRFAAGIAIFQSYRHAAWLIGLALAASIASYFYLPTVLGVVNNRGLSTLDQVPLFSIIDWLVLAAIFVFFARQKLVRN